MSPSSTFVTAATPDPGRSAPGGSLWDVCHPSPSRQHGLPRDVALRDGAVVVGSDEETLLLAVADPSKPGLATRLASAARRPVRLLPAAAEEIELALAGCHERTDVAEQVRKRLLSLTDRLGLCHRLPKDLQAPVLHEQGSLIADVDGNDGALPEDSVGPIALTDRDFSRLRSGPTHLEDTGRDTGRDTKVPPTFEQGDRNTGRQSAPPSENNSWGPELLGLVYGLPHLPLTSLDLPVALRLLLPPHLRDSQEGQYLTPWRVDGDTLLLACSSMPHERIIRAIEEWSGFAPRCILADPSVVQGVARSHRTSEPPVHRKPPRWRSRLSQPAQSSSIDETRLRAIARQTGESLETIEQRYGPERSTQKQLPLPRPKLEAQSMLPPRLMRSLGCLPLALDQEVLDLAIADDCSHASELAEAISLVTGRDIRIRRFPSSSVQRALLQLSTSDVSASPAVRRASGFDDVALAAAGDEEVARSYRLAARHALPFIRLEHYTIRADALASVPFEHFHALGAVPLLREDRVLWVALAEPDEAVIDDLGRLNGLAVRPLIATPSAIRERLASLSEIREISRSEERLENPILTALQSDGIVTKADLLRVLKDPEEPLDQALERAGLLSFHQYCDVASRVTGHAAVDLRLRRHDEEIVDALGRRTRRPLWTDPVDPAVSAALSPATMRDLGILPVRLEGGRLLVAVADPFDPSVQPVLDDLAPEHPVLVLAPRPAILTAIARVRGHMPLGDLLLTRGMVAPPELARALQLSRTAGVRLGQALLNLGLITQDQLAYVLAEQQDLPFFHLDGLEPDEQVARLLPEEVERTLGVVPLYHLDDALVVATPDPLNQKGLDEVSARTGYTVGPVVCTEDDFESLLETLYRDEYLHISTSELVARTPDESASTVLSQRQQIAILLFGVAVLALLVRAPALLGTALTAVCTLFYVAFSMYRSYLIYHSLSNDLEVPVSDEEVAALRDEDLPIYTILVPLYKEAAVLPTLLLGLARLNYPSTKLDVKLLLEEDDVETREAVASMPLPAYVHPVVVPAAQPRCKPKACNYGLLHARGEYVVIYDAEDVPDPDQLKKVVVAFRKGGEDMACLQAKLNYYNSRQNLLTAWFTNEYSMWFDLFLPGLDAANVPIPLGGTSNHFPTARLREIGAWDPYNVTEDADLGVRLYRRGWKTGVVDSTTLEEANSEVYNWIRQRSRWVKGYIQTYLVHMRHPITMWRRLGTKAFFSFNMVVGGTSIAFLLNPIFWCLTATWYLSHAGFIRAIFPAPVFYLGMFSLAIGNFAFIYLNMAACLRRGHFGMVKYALISPLYWALMSTAAWKGFIQLWTNPFYWEKTTHGLYQPGAKRPAPDTPGASS